MTCLADVASLVRSKNAGPFWLTIDIFFDTPADYQRVCEQLTATDVARLFNMDPSKIQRFDIASLNVIKISLPRPVVQGSRLDRDMHGAQWATLLGAMSLS